MGCGLSMSYDLFFKSLNDNDTAYPEGGRVMAVSQCFIVENRHESRYRLYYDKVTRVRSASQTGQGISCGKVQRVSQFYVSLVSGGSHLAAKCIEILFNLISCSYHDRLYIDGESLKILISLLERIYVEILKHQVIIR